MGDPTFPLVAAYLGVLHAQLGEATPGRARILAEAEDHLLEAVRHAMAEGLTPEAAQRRAIARFGAADVVAAAFLRASGTYPVFDGRDGLPAVAVEELRRARRLVLAQKAGRTAVLGFWVPDSAGGDPAEHFGAILVRQRRNGPLLPELGPTVFADLGRDPRWQHDILPHLRPGLQVNVEHWEGELRLWFGPIADAPAACHQIYVAFGPRDRRPPPRSSVPGTGGTRSG